MEAKKKEDINISQNTKIQIVESNAAIALLEKAPFEIQFYNKLYQAESGANYALRLAAFYDKAQIPIMKLGMAITDITCFKPGTGMATNFNGKYNTLICNPNGHSYLFYADEDSNRLKRINKKGAKQKFSFLVDSIKFHDATVSVSNTHIDEVYCVWVKDLNLNGIIDKGEFGTFILRFRENYIGEKVPYWNQQDSDGRTPLHNLVLKNIPSAKRNLLLKEALDLSSTDPNIKDAYGNTAMHYAMNSGNINTYYFPPSYENYGAPDTAIVQLLLESKKLNPNLKNFYFQYTPLQAYLHMSEKGMNRLSLLGLYFIKTMLNHPEFDIESRDASGMSTYDVAIKKSFMDDVNTAVLERLRPMNSYNHAVVLEMERFLTQLDYNAPLSDSTFYLDNIQLLLEHKVYPNTFIGGQTIIHYLCDGRYRPYGYDEEEIISNSQLRAMVLKRLFESPLLDINLPDSEGDNALFYAVDDVNPIVVSTLLSHRQIDIYHRNSKGNTALMQLLDNGIQRHRKNDWLTCFRLFTSHFNHEECILSTTTAQLINCIDAFIVQYKYGSEDDVIKIVKDFRNMLIALI